MNRDHIISLAKECGFWQEHTNTFMCNTKDIELFYQQAQREAYERAAQAVCAVRPEEGRLMQDQCLAAIRKLKEES